MSKLNVRDVAEVVGKGTIRGIANVGINIAVVGGGWLGTLLYAGTCKNVVLKTAVMVVGGFGSLLAGYAVSDLVDDKLVEMGLEIDGI